MRVRRRDKRASATAGAVAILDPPALIVAVGRFLPLSVRVDVTFRRECTGNIVERAGSGRLVNLEGSDVR